MIGVILYCVYIQYIHNKIVMMLWTKHANFNICAHNVLYL